MNFRAGAPCQWRYPSSAAGGVSLGLPADVKATIGGGSVEQFDAVQLDSPRGSVELERCSSVWQVTPWSEPYRCITLSVT